MPNTKHPVNWNTLLLTAGFSALGYIGSGMFNELRLTHDAVIIIKSQMVSHSEFDLQISEVRSRLSQVEVEIQKLKEHRQP